MRFFNFLCTYQCNIYVSIQEFSFYLTSFHYIYKSLNPITYIYVYLGNQLTCDICVDIMVDIDEFITSETTEAEIIAFVQQVKLNKQQGWNP